MIRSFVAVEIPQFQEINRMLDLLRNSGARLSIPKHQGLHITLKFLGDIKEESVENILELLRSVVIDFNRFSVNVEKVGGFPNLRNPRVLWVGVEDSGKLSEIAKVINLKLTSLGFEKETRPFRSHITVARVKSRSNIERAISIMREFENVQFGEFTVEEIKLKKSTLTPTGAIYEDLGIIPLPIENEADG